MGDRVQKTVDQSSEARKGHKPSILCSLSSDFSTLYRRPVAIFFDRCHAILTSQSLHGLPLTEAVVRITHRATGKL